MDAAKVDDSTVFSIAFWDIIDLEIGKSTL